MTVILSNIFFDPLSQLVWQTLGVGIVACLILYVFRESHWVRSGLKWDYHFGRTYLPEVAIGILAAGALVFYGLARHYLFESFQLGIWDFGIFDSALWRLAHGLPGEMVLIGRAHWLGDHFQPILLLIVPFYWLWDSPHVLLWLELIATVSGVIPLIALTRHYLKSGLLRITLAAVYLAFPGIYAALLYPFHPSTLVAPLLLWAFYCFDTRRWWGYFIFLGLALMTKENAGVYVAAYGLWQILTTSKRKVGWITILVGAGVTLGAVFFLIPFLRQGPYSQNYWLDPRLTGLWVSGPIAALGKILSLAVDHKEKLQLILTGLGGFGFVPLLFPEFFPFLPFFAERLFTGQSGIYSLFYHYGAPIAAPFVYMSIRGIARLEHKSYVFAWGAMIVLIMGSILSYRALGINPADRLRSLETSTEESHVLSLQRILKRIPAGASVFAQDAIVPHLAHRAQITPLEFQPSAPAEYVLVDLEAGLGHASPERLREVLLAVASDPRYTAIAAERSVILWQLDLKYMPPKI